MDSQDPNRVISMVNPRGRVTWVRRWEIHMLREQGYRIINNPKEEYYPEYDQTSHNAESVIEGTESPSLEEDLLEGEEV